MNDSIEHGYFMLSFDTELALGYYDGLPPGRFSADGRRERDAIRQLLDILDEFDIAATWAVVGHLFYERCEHCALCPVQEWSGRYPTFEMVYGTDHPLFYGADVIEMLLDRGSRHEIAFHGYTHRSFDERKTTSQDALCEIKEWCRVAQRKGIVPQTAIFPRNRVGHLELFQGEGFIGYRGNKVLPPISSVPLLGKVLNRIDVALDILPPQPYDPMVDDDTGLVNLPASQWLFQLDRRIELVLDRLSLYNLRIRKMVRAAERAATERKTMHLWAHPHEFRTARDFGKLRYVLEAVAKQVQAGALRSITMADLARLTLAKHAQATGV
jgi:hypothetical protein